jgi:hypothetical protein
MQTYELKQDFSLWMEHEEYQQVVDCDMGMNCGLTNVFNGHT